MLPLDILRFPTKHRQRHRRLDIPMPIDTRRNGVDDHVPDIGVLAQLPDLLLLSRGEVIIDQLLDSFYVVGLYDGAEDWEPVLDVERVLEPVGEDSGDLDLIAWSCGIDVVAEENDVLVAGDSSWGDSSWGFLYGDFLVVSVDGFLGVDGEWAFGLADDAVTEVDFGVVVLVDGSFFLATTIAHKPDLLKLRKHLRPPGHHPTDLNHSVKVHLPQIPQSILNRKRLDLHINLVVDILIPGVPLLGDLKCNLIEIGNNNARFISDPVGEDCFRLRQVYVVNLQGLLVQVTHLLELLRVDQLLLLIFEDQDEPSELLPDPSYSSRFLDPGSQLSLCLLDIQMSFVFTFLVLFVLSDFSVL